jgi:outer membrane protein assembly factor BamB
VIYGDLMYIVNNQGIVTAHNAKTGERIYQQRLGAGGSYSASPVAADGKIYFSSEDGDVYVVKAGLTFELLAKNSVGEVVMASPALSGDLLIVRGMKHVIGLGTNDSK